MSEKLENVLRGSLLNLQLTESHNDEYTKAVGSKMLQALAPIKHRIMDESF